MSSFSEYKSVEKLKKLSQNPIDLTKEEILTTERVMRMRSQNCGFKLLYAMQRVDEDTFSALFELAEESKAIEKMQAMQRGAVVNFIEGIESENRRVMHTATRDFFEDSIETEEATNARKLAFGELEKLQSFTSCFDKYTHLVQIGIGGSDLGPRALHFALRAYRKVGKKVDFVSNVDPDDLFFTLDQLDLSKTLIVSVSKSGTTLETLTNEHLLRDALRKRGLVPKDHIIAVTQKGSPMDDPSSYLASFYIWDYIGGRYSATSMVGGVSLSFALGIENYKKVLLGANRMDKVAMSLDITANLPLLSALFGIWNRNFLNFPLLAVVPYSQALLYFPSHLQQCDMESNGKSVDRKGNFIDFVTGPALFGEVGTNGQHSFFQLIHQGTSIIPIEFIGFKNSQRQQDLLFKGTFSQEKLLANLFAQSIALAKGQRSCNPNKFFPGNRPSSILLGEKLDPLSMGALLAYYEHKIAFQGFIWDINSFDQEGVQLGKVLASSILNIFKSRRENRKSSPFPLAEAYLKELQ